MSGSRIIMVTSDCRFTKDLREVVFLRFLLRLFRVALAY